jgi:hypothetical protein
MSKPIHPETSLSDSADPEQWKRDLRETDFDGHTHFHTMSFTQKLVWLSEAVSSIYLIAKENPQAGLNKRFHLLMGISDQAQ